MRADDGTRSNYFAFGYWAKEMLRFFFEALPTHGSSRLLMYVELVNGGKKNFDE